MISCFKISRFPVNDHHRNLTVEDRSRIQAKTVKNPNHNNSTSCKSVATRSLYEDRGSTSKNACVNNDGGKIISKCNNTYYHVNNNANRQQHQHQQQQYIKHAPLRNLPSKSKYSQRCNISNSSDEDNSSQNSPSIHYFDRSNISYKNDSVESCSYDSNFEYEISEQENSVNQNQNTYPSDSTSKTLRRRGVSCDGYVNLSPHRKNVATPYGEKRLRSSSIGVYCDPKDCSVNTDPDTNSRKSGTGYVTILKINDSSAIEGAQQKKVNITDVTKAAQKINRVSNVNQKHIGDSKISELKTKVKNDGSVVVKVKDPLAINKRVSLVDVKSRRKSISSDTYDPSSIPSKYTTQKENIPTQQPNSKETYKNQVNSKYVDVSREIKRVQSNLTKPTQSSSLKRHSSVCTGELNVSRSRHPTPVASKDRRLSVDKAIQCRSSSSSSFKFRSLVSLFLFFIFEKHAGYLQMSSIMYQVINIVSYK